MSKPRQPNPTGAILLEDGAMIAVLPNNANTRLVMQIMESPFDFGTVTLHPAEILALIQLLTAELNQLKETTHIV